MCSTTYNLTASDSQSGAFDVSVANRAGNTATAAFTLAEDTLAPSVAIDTPSAVGLSVRVSWAGVDMGSGVRNYDVQVKEGSGSWTDL